MGLCGLKSRCWEGCVPFQKLQGRGYFLAFSRFHRPLPSLGLWPPSSIFKAGNGGLGATSFSRCLPELLLLPPSSTFKYAGKYTRPIWDNLPILGLTSYQNPTCNLNFPLPCNVTYWQIPEIGLWSSLGGGRVGTIIMPTTAFLVKETSSVLNTHPWIRHMGSLSLHVRLPTENAKFQTFPSQPLN